MSLTALFDEVRCKKNSPRYNIDRVILSIKEVSNQDVVPGLRRSQSADDVQARRADRWKKAPPPGVPETKRPGKTPGLISFYVTRNAISARNPAP
jgi:hypothetical protein